METKWRRGETLFTPQTKRWPKQEFEQNDIREKSRIYSRFSNGDLGKSRELVCFLNTNHPEYEQNAKLIAAAPDLLYALCEARDALILASLIDKSNTCEKALKICDTALKQLEK